MSDLVFSIFEISIWELKKYQDFLFPINHGLSTKKPSRCKEQVQINFEKKSNANFENPLKQETINLAICYFAIFFKFSNTYLQALKKIAIRQNQGI